MQSLPRIKAWYSVVSLVGGSTMGYKLAGYNVIGCNEIDKRMMSVYQTNHHPRYSFLEPIQVFKTREELPAELFNLDILDGSPPCSTFSMAGSREESWGIEKKFREGQAEQVLDTLFFDFIELAKRLQPKIVVAENVKGLLLGDAKKYLQRIYAEFDDAGYYCQHFLLNAALMGVPQRRERVFFICLRKDLIKYVPQTGNLFESTPRLDLSFDEPPISCREANLTVRKKPITGPSYHRDYALLLQGKKPKNFQNALVDYDSVHPTLTSRYGEASGPIPTWSDPIAWLDDISICKISSFPLDYDFGNQRPGYICGMSVPPVMMANIATRIYEQWLSNINSPTT